MEEKNITLRVTIGRALRGSGRIIQTTLKANVKNGNHTKNFCTNIYNVLVNNSYCKPSIIDQGYVPFALSFTNNDSLKIKLNQHAIQPNTVNMETIAKYY